LALDRFSLLMEVLVMWRTVILMTAVAVVAFVGVRTVTAAGCATGQCGAPIQIADHPTAGADHPTAKTDHPTAVAPALKPQETCPVMGGKINKELFADVDGKRVYVCCAGCIQPIQADPAKFLKVLADRGEAVEVLAAEAQPEINTGALTILIRLKVPMVLLDARGAKAAAKGTIPGAKALAPLAADEEVAKAAPDKEALIVTFCASVDCGASSKLATRLRAMGYKNVLEYPQGMKGWAEAQTDAQ
jgi:rhodanese-related sulfurtransferase